MPGKHLKDIDDITGYWVVALGMWGAIINFVSRKKEKVSRTKKVLLFFFDVISSGGIAIVAYLLIDGFYQNELLAVGAAGVMAHMGTRAFYILEQVISQKLGVKL